MTTTLPLSSRIYARLVRLYPEDLRRDYGAEMVLVFGEDLSAARRQTGWRGVLRTWRCAVAEFIRFALLCRLSSPAFRVPAIATAILGGSMIAQVSALWRHAPNVSAFFHAVGVALLLPILATPIVSLLAVWVCHGHRTISIALHEDHDPCSKSAI
jgi:hypothetical protein